MAQRVLITAGASGIGLAMARAFAAGEARVWVADVDAVALAALPEGIRGARVDASDEAAMDGLFAAIAAEWGGLDVLCANAGIKGPTASVAEMPMVEWRECLSVNLDGAMLAARGSCVTITTVRPPSSTAARSSSRIS
jgi:NAD(P)-dependent dehydrogenase (short-subunit alcohol dehydrogenase family)